MRKIWMLSLLAILPYLLSGQRQYLDATITTNDGQKIVGEIAVETWLATPRSIDFQTKEGSLKTYRVADLSHFEVTRYDGVKQYYTRYTGNIEVSPVRMDRLDNNPDLHYQQDTTWLQLIYQGAWSLYSMVEPSSKVHYFLKTDNQEIVELVSKIWLKENKFERVDIFRKKINDLGQGCPEVMKLAGSSTLVSSNRESLSLKGLVKLCEAYDKCKGTSAIYRMKDEKGLWTGNALAGWHWSTVSVADAGITISNIQNIHLGLSFDYFIARSNKRVSWFNELVGYHESKKDSTFVNFTAIKGQATYKAFHLAATSMISVRITKNPLSPTLKIGLINRLQFKRVFSFRDIAPPLGRFFDLSSKRKLYEIGPAIGISGGYGRIGLDARYSISSMVVGSPNAKKANTKVLAISATYRFL